MAKVRCASSVIQDQPANAHLDNTETRSQAVLVSPISVLAPSRVPHLRHVSMAAASTDAKELFVESEPCVTVVPESVSVSRRLSETPTCCACLHSRRPNVSLHAERMRTVNTE